MSILIKSLPRFFALLIVVNIGASAALASAGPSSSGAEQAPESAPQGGPKNTGIPSSEPIEFVNCAVEKEVLRDCLELLRAQFEYEKAKWNIITATLDAQRKSSYVILALVVIVTLAGLGFAGYQLVRGAPNSASKQPQSTIVWSATGLKVASSVGGLSVLGFSLAFLSMYIHEVYRIDVLRLANSKDVVERPRSLRSTRRPSSRWETDIPLPATVQ